MLGLETTLLLCQDSGFPCFKGGPRTIQNLRKRFHLGLTEEVSELSSFFSVVVVILVLVITRVSFFYLFWGVLSAMRLLGPFPN